MNLIPLFPDLQTISRNLRQLYSSVQFSYSETAIRLRAKVDKPEHPLRAPILWAGVIGTCSIVAFLHEAYTLGVATALLGFFFVWSTYRTRNSSPNIKVIRLQNEVVIDTVAQLITVEHLNPYFQEYAAESTEVPFAEVLQVVACKGKVQSEGEDYGQVYVVLTDETRLYLIEVESERVARSVARVLQQVLGLPVEPEPKSWWQF